MDEDAARRLPVLGRARLDPWFNTPDGEPLRRAALRGRVAPLGFWTFACVSCRRILPFLRRMHGQYQPDFTVVGVHTEAAIRAVLDEAVDPAAATEAAS
jgi:hypothetical protein